MVGTEGEPSWAWCERNPPGSQGAVEVDQVVI